MLEFTSYPAFADSGIRCRRVVPSGRRSQNVAPSLTKFTSWSRPQAPTALPFSPHGHRRPLPIARPPSPETPCHTRRGAVPKPTTAQEPDRPRHESSAILNRSGSLPSEKPSVRKSEPRLPTETGAPWRVPSTPWDRYRTAIEYSPTGRHVCPTRPAEESPNGGPEIACRCCVYDVRKVPGPAQAKWRSSQDLTRRCWAFPYIHDWPYELKAPDLPTNRCSTPDQAARSRFPELEVTLTGHHKVLWRQM